MTTFLVLAGVLAGTGSYSLWRSTRRSAPVSEDRADYFPVLPPSITPIITDLVERAVEAGDPVDAD